MRFLQILLLLFASVTSQRYEKNYRFSVLQNIFYQSFYDYNMFNSECAILQMTPISDRQISFQLYSKKFDNSTIIKSEMQYLSDYETMKCFDVNPVISSLDSICIKEIAVPNPNYIIFTNKANNFYYGMVSSYNYNNLLFNRLLLYNKSQLVQQDCFFSERV